MGLSEREAPVSGLEGIISMDVHTLREFVKDFLTSAPSLYETKDWWQAPLLTTAPVDRRFEQLPRIASDDHIHPHDLLPTARSVVVFFIPFKQELVRKNKRGERPCHDWGVAYVQTNDLIGRLSQALGDLMADQGLKSHLTPATHNFDEAKLMARWSHKHLAHLAGLGRFGVHRMLITSAGCAGRLGSLVTEAELGDHPVIQTEEACLVKAGRKCGQCVEACPVQALSAEGFDRQRCWHRLKENRNTLNYLFDLPETTHVCGKCAALVPCSFENPVACSGLNYS